MYTLRIARDFNARHYLVGGNWGGENEEHVHRYRVELSVEGPELDRHGYLVDLTDLEAHLEEVIGGFRDRVLNQLPCFEGSNPSIERLARILCDGICSRLKDTKALSLWVRVWENENAWASYRREMP